jgi:hypothetical protein
MTGVWGVSQSLLDHGLDAVVANTSMAEYSAAPKGRGVPSPDTVAPEMPCEWRSSATAWTQGPGCRLVEGVVQGRTAMPGSA